jgi:hypothetical protein
MLHLPRLPHQRTRITLTALEAFIGLCALVGGFAVLTGAFGFAQWLPPAFLEDTPFADYIVPGLVLLLVIGGGMLVAAGTIAIQREWAVLVSASIGVVMVGFELIEAVIIDRNPQALVPPTIVQQILMGGLGLIIFALAASLWAREYPRHHIAAGCATHA